MFLRNEKNDLLSKYNISESQKYAKKWAIEARHKEYLPYDSIYMKF